MVLWLQDQGLRQTPLATGQREEAALHSLSGHRAAPYPGSILTPPWQAEGFPKEEDTEEKGALSGEVALAVNCEHPWFGSTRPGMSPQPS